MTSKNIQINYETIDMLRKSDCITCNEVSKFIQLYFKFNYIRDISTVEYNRIFNNGKSVYPTCTDLRLFCDTVDFNKIPNIFETMFVDCYEIKQTDEKFTRVSTLFIGPKVQKFNFNHFPNLVELNIKNDVIDNPFFLKKLKKLKKLNIHSTRVDYNILLSIPNLEEICVLQPIIEFGYDPFMYIITKVKKATFVNMFQDLYLGKNIYYMENMVELYLLKNIDETYGQSPLYETIDVFNILKLPKLNILRIQLTYQQILDIFYHETLLNNIEILIIDNLNPDLFNEYRTVKDRFYFLKCVDITDIHTEFFSIFVKFNSLYKIRQNFPNISYEIYIEH